MAEPQNPLEREMLIEEGDRDSVDMADQLVRLMAKKIDAVEDANRNIMLQNDFDKLIKNSLEVIKQSGRVEDERQVSALSDEFKNAVAKGDMKLALDKKEQVRSVFVRVYSKTPEFWVGWFINLCEAIQKSCSDNENARILMNQGNKAIENGFIADLQQICFDLLNMLPKNEQEIIKSQII